MMVLYVYCHRLAQGSAWQGLEIDHKENSASSEQDHQLNSVKAKVGLVSKYGQPAGIWDSVGP